MEIIKLLTEEQENPIGLDEATPAFSWQIASPQQNVMQVAYSLCVRKADDQQTVWQTGRIDAATAANILYAGAPLEGCQRYQVTLHVWDNHGQEAVREGFFETGLMDSSLAAWEGAAWIAAPRFSVMARTRGVFRIETTFRLTAGADRAGLVFGARDARLMDESLNEYGLAGENYIRYELNVSKQTLDIYRVGYALDDCADVPFASVPLPEGLLKTGDSAFHTLSVLVMGNHAQAFLDGTVIDQPQPHPQIPGRVLNPRGCNDVLTYPRLNEIGFFAGETGVVLFQNLRVANVRLPGAVFIDETPAGGMHGDTIFAALPVQEGCFALQHQQVTADPSNTSIPMLRRACPVRDGLTRARLYITARGIYEAVVNGHVITSSPLAPGLTQYDKRMQYQTYDVTKLLTPGENALGVTLSSGWWSDAQTFAVSHYNYFGDKEALLCKLVLEYADGQREVIVSDPNTWRYFGEGPWQYAGLFMGEQYDARHAALASAYALPGFDDSAWEHPVPYQPVTIPGYDPGFGSPWPTVNATEPLLIGGYDAPVHIVETRQATHHIQQSDHVHLYDFGQEMAGVPEITFHEAAGTRILIRCGEVLYPDMPRYGRNIGRLMQENYRDAESTDVYICAGLPEGETYRPRFTFHGFRYLEINGVTHAPQLSEVKAHQYSSITEFDGSFSSSDAVLNRFAENVKWSQRCNFINIPTDCPQRNERMGWVGDTHVFCNTALHNSNLKAFYERNLQAMADLQDDEGRYPEIAPIGGGFGGITYECATIFMSWELYQQYGDRRTLARFYPGMQRYMAYLSHMGMPGIGREDRIGPLGDWLAFDETDSWLMWNAFYYRAALLMEKIATVLSRTEDAHAYAILKSDIRRYWNRVFVDPETGRTRTSTGGMCDTQCSYALGICYEIADDPVRMGAHLARKVQENGHRVSTGFFGTGLVNKALSQHGYRDDAWQMLLQRAFPSWLYPVTQGATTIWEHWDSFTAENGFGEYNSMNSFNHYSLGSVLSWMYDEILGIQRLAEHPGFTHFRLQPDVRMLSYAHGRVASPAGPIESGWRRENGCIHYACTIPANTTATLHLPDGTVHALGSGHYEFTMQEGRNT